MKPCQKDKPDNDNKIKRPYEKPRILEERKLEALAVVCGGLFDMKQFDGQYNGTGYCTALYS